MLRRSAYTQYKKFLYTKDLNEGRSREESKPLHSSHTSLLHRSGRAAQRDDRGQTMAAKVIHGEFQNPIELQQYLGAPFTFFHKTLPTAQVCTQRLSSQLDF